MSNDERDELEERVAELLPDPGAVDMRSMFGARAFMIRGKLALAVGSEADLLVRVRRERFEELLERPGASWAGMGDRHMGRGWVRVDPEHAGDDDELALWVSEALLHNADVTRG